MKKIFPYDVVKELIQKGGFGTYRLYTLPDNALVAGSHLLADQNETDTKMSVDNLIVDLEGNIDLMGDGLYRIVLKKSIKTQTVGEVAYTFQVDDRGDKKTEAQPQLGGTPMSGEKIEELVNTRVHALLDAKIKEMEAKREVEDLKREIAELKKRKPSKKKNDLHAFAGMGIVAASAFITEQWPNTKTIVEKALDSIGGMIDDEEEEEEETGFTKPS